MTRTQRWVLAITSAAALMVALDQLVVATALNAIRTDLHASIATLEWTANAYSLSFAVLLVTGASLGDRFGRRRMLATGLAVFTLASGGVRGGARDRGAVRHSYAAAVAPLVIAGCGASMAIPAGQNAVMNAGPAVAIGQASPPCLRPTAATAAPARSVTASVLPSASRPACPRWARSPPP